MLYYSAFGGEYEELEELKHIYRDVRWGLKLHAGNVGCEGSVLSLPHGCAFLVARLLLDDDALVRLGLE